MSESLRERIARAIEDKADAWAAGEGCDELLDWAPDYRNALADAALAAIEASGTHVVVPAEPTEEMIEATGIKNRIAARAVILAALAVRPRDV